MAYMIQTGPDTFKYVSDEEEARQRAFMERDAQPRPAGLVPVRDGPETPVTELKRRTAHFTGYTPEATQMMYDTPTMVRVQDYEAMQRRGDPAGHYQYAPEPGGHRIMVYQPPALTPEEKTKIGPAYHDPARNVMAHEFGHLWEHQVLPAEKQQQWDRTWPAVVFPDQPESRNKMYDYLRAGEDMAQGEWYANQQMYGADATNQHTNKPMLTPEQQDYWYPGLFRPEPKPIPPTSDHLRGNYTSSKSDVLRPNYAPPSWVPDTNGLLGYSGRYG